MSLRDGAKLSEPPAVEGYLDRIKANSQTKAPVYMASHDGDLFSLNPAHANPPSPPGLHPPKETAESLRETEVRRGVQQVINATAVCDVRSILTVRRAFHLAPQSSHSANHPSNGSSPQDDDGDWLGTWAIDATEDDEHDIGGEEGLATSEDKPKLRMHRAFELLLKNGRLIRFEVSTILVSPRQSLLSVRRPIHADWP